MRYLSNNYIYTRVDGSEYKLTDPFPYITATYWGRPDPWHLEDKITWDELAPSLQELIIRKIGWDDLKSDVTSRITDLETRVTTEVNRLDSKINKEIQDRKDADAYLQEQMDQLRKRVEDLERRMDNVENEISRLWGEVNDCKDRLDNIEANVSAISDTVSTTNTFISSLPDVNVMEKILGSLTYQIGGYGQGVSNAAYDPATPSTIQQNSRGWVMYHNTFEANTGTNNNLRTCIVNRNSKLLATSNSSYHQGTVNIHGIVYSNLKECIASDQVEVQFVPRHTDFYFSCPLVFPGAYFLNANAELTLTGDRSFFVYAGALSSIKESGFVTCSDVYSANGESGTTDSTNSTYAGAFIYIYHVVLGAIPPDPIVIRLNVQYGIAIQDYNTSDSVYSSDQTVARIGCPAGSNFGNLSDRSAALGHPSWGNTGGYGVMPLKFIDDYTWLQGVRYNTNYTALANQLKSLLS